MKQPTLFLPHGGGPCFFLNENGPVPEEWRRMGDFLGHVIADLPQRPRAILVVSGHWEMPRFTVHEGQRPDMLYDYTGFPPHTYRLRWHAPAAPARSEESRVGKGCVSPCQVRGSQYNYKKTNTHTTTTRKRLKIQN